LTCSCALLLCCQHFLAHDRLLSEPRGRSGALCRHHGRFGTMGCAASAGKSSSSPTRLPVPPKRVLLASFRGSIPVIRAKCDCEAGSQRFAATTGDACRPHYAVPRPHPGHRSRGYHASTLLDLADAAFKSRAIVAEHPGRLWACSTCRSPDFDTATSPVATGVGSTLEGDAGELPRGHDHGADSNFESRGGQIWSNGQF